MKDFLYEKPLFDRKFEGLGLASPTLCCYSLGVVARMGTMKDVHWTSHPSEILGFPGVNGCQIGW